MTSSRVLLDSAAFLGSPGARELAGLPPADVRRIVTAFLEACYQDLGKAPRLLEGDEMATLLREVLPRHFGVRDPLAGPALPVLGAYLDFLAETEVVAQVRELRTALDEHGPAFLEAVRSGAAHRDGVALTGPGTTIVHRADKTGRNDPCPCGSGRKFKKCCWSLGGS